MATLILFGRPASGKGTVGQRLVESGYLALFDRPSDARVGRGALHEQQALRATMAAGGYGSDELAVRIVREFIQGLPAGTTGVILDGFPRDLAQLDAWLAAPIDHGIGVLVDTPEAVCRSTHRRSHGLPGVRLDGSGAGNGLRPLRSGAPTTRGRRRRSHLRPPRPRLRDRVAPVIDAWARADLPFIRLDGTRDVDAIAAELLDEVARLEAG